MKIAFVANTCWNIYNFRKGLVQYFLSQGHKVLVFAPKDEYSEKLIEWGVHFVHTPLESTGANPLKDFSYLINLIKLFKSVKPDIALSFTIKSNIYSSLASRLTTTPIICNVSGLGTAFLVKGIAGKMALMLYKIAFRYSSYIFFQNQDDRKMFTTNIKLDDSKVRVLPGSGINLNEFRSVEYQINQPLKVLMIARIIIEKGVREYAEAAKAFKDDNRICFTLIGKFDETHSRSVDRVELDQWIDSGSINYQAHSNDIAEIIADHDLIVLPSYREGTPRTLLEGAALGKPLLASDVPGCRDVVDNGFNGFLFEAQKSESLVDKIKLFLSLNDDEKAKLASNSRKLVEKRFDENIVIDMYDQTIRRIIGSS